VGEFDKGENTVMEWGSPHNFVWLWALPVLPAVFFFASQRKKLEMRRFGEAALVERLAASLDVKRRLLKKILFTMAVACVVLALAEPHFRKKETLVERKGIDVVIAVDVSDSMLAKDIPPSRLEKAKLELSELIDKLKEHRIGIVAFAGEAFIQCPLTLDKNAAKLFLSTVSPNLIPTPGTSITSAIRVATRTFSEKEKESKALILLTDGENHEGEAVEAARLAKKEGVRIFVIGIGTPDGSTLPNLFGQEGFKRDKEGRPVLSKLNEPLLKEIAGSTGGIYTRASRGEFEIDRIAGEIQKIAQKGLKNELSVEYEENYQYFLVLAFVLLLAEMFLSERKRI